MKTDLVKKQKGFTLLEVLFVIAIVSILLTGTILSITPFVNSSKAESSKTSVNSDTAIALNLIERELMLSGYGLPYATRVAADFNCQYSDPNFCMQNSDRLFIANGVGIVCDMTVDGYDDGTINDSSLTQIGNAKMSNNDGFYAQLINSSTTQVTVSGPNISAPLDIDYGYEFCPKNPPSSLPCPTLNDFTYSSGTGTNYTAFIIADNTPLAHPPKFAVNGYRLSSTSGNALILLQPDEVFKPGNWPNTDTIYIVPANAWYVRLDPNGATYPDGSQIYWLYRNNDPVIPYVSQFKVMYGYDSPTGTNGVSGYDGIEGDPWSGLPAGPNQQWDHTVPTSIQVDGAAFSGFNELRAVAISLSVKIYENGVFQTTTYTKTVELRNTY